MQHTLRPEPIQFTVMFWMGDDMGVYKQTVYAQSHPEAAYRAISRANDGNVVSVAKKKGFKAVTMAALDDVDSFEGPLEGTALLDGIVRAPYTKDEWKALQAAEKAARAAAKVSA